jgi:hypothetical protein
MSIFNNTLDYLKGFPSSLKKEYSSFLSAALFYMPNFKINNLKNGDTSAEIEYLQKNLKIKLTLNRNNKKIDELKTTIYDFMSQDKIKSCEKYKNINEYLSFEEYKNKRNISRQSSPNLYRIMGETWLDAEFLALANERAYLEYLYLKENKEKISSLSILNIMNKEKSFSKQERLDRQRLQNHYETYGFSWHQKISAQFLLDSDFKCIDPYERIIVLNNLKDWRHDFNEIYLSLLDINPNVQSNTAFNAYKKMNIRYMKLSIQKDNSIIHEDIRLVDGNNAARLHEDDFFFFDHTMNIMFSNINKI